MSASANPGWSPRWIFAAVLACAAIGCGSTPARDINYGTDKGADFQAPVVDAHSDAASDAGVAGAAGSAPTGGAAGSDASGAGGAAGGGDAGGAAGVSGQAGVDGSAGAA